MHKIIVISMILCYHISIFGAIKEISEIEYTEVIKSGTGDILNVTKTLKAGDEAIENKGERPIKLSFGRKGSDGHGSLLPNSKLKLLDKKDQKADNVNLDIFGDGCRFKIVKMKSETFRVRGPSFVTGVRGTTFTVTEDAVKLPEGTVGVTPIVDGKEDASKVQELQAGNQATIDGSDVKIEKLEDVKKEWARIAPHEVFPPLIPVCIEVKPAQVPQPMGLKVDWKGHKVVGDKVIVNKCYMAKNEMTNKEYNVFLEWYKLTGSREFSHPDEPENYDHSPAYSAIELAQGADKPEKSVSGLSYFDAYACAKFYDGRLPTSFEYLHLGFWEKTKKWDDTINKETSTKILNLIDGLKEVCEDTFDNTSHFAFNYNKEPRHNVNDTLNNLLNAMNIKNGKAFLSSSFSRKYYGFRIVYDEKPPKQLKPVYKE